MNLQIARAQRYVMRPAPQEQTRVTLFKSRCLLEIIHYLHSCSNSIPTETTSKASIETS